MSASLLRPDSALMQSRSTASCGRRTPFVSCSAFTPKGRCTRSSRPAACQPRKLTRPTHGVVRVCAYSSEGYNDAYVCLGLAQCFQKSDGGLQPVLVIEPLSASSLECLANGSRTSYKLVTGINYGEAMRRDREALPEPFRNAHFCENYEFRCDAATRTWLRPHAQDNLMDIVPLGKVRGDFNFSLEDKRIMNMENIVNDADNVKQDMSIDVYGRKKADDLKAKKAAAETAALAAEEAKVAKKQQEEEDLDALLLA